MDIPTHPDASAPRTSLLSLLALGLSIMCPVPLFGLAGAVLGGISLRRISASGGTLTGGAPAKAAVILGTIATAGQLYLFFGAMQAWTFYRKQMQPAMVQAFEAIESGVVDSAPPVFGTAVLEELTPARLEAVRTVLSEQVGTGVAVRIGMREQVKSFQTLVRTRSVQPGTTMGSADSTAVPCTIHAGEAELFAWVFFDADMLQPGNVLVTDVLVQLADGSALTLLPAGPASELATSWLGWDVMELHESPR